MTKYNNVEKIPAFRKGLGFIAAPLNCSIAYILLKISTEGLTWHEFTLHFTIAIIAVYITTPIPGILLIALTYNFSITSRILFCLLGTIIGILSMAFLVFITGNNIANDLDFTLQLGGSVGLIWSLTYSLIAFRTNKSTAKIMKKIANIFK